MRAGALAWSTSLVIGAALACTMADAEAQIDQGRRLYDVNCVACHQTGGQ